MRCLLARLNHETNTFSPVDTTIEAFNADGAPPAYGNDAAELATGSNTGLGGFIELCEQRGYSYDIAVCAMAFPSGTVCSTAYETLTNTIVEQCTAHQYDCVLLDLHGAMVTEGVDDGEGELLARVRQALPETPIGVVFDLHGKITPNIVDNTTVLVSFKTYPHIDMKETGLHVARLVFEILENSAAARPTIHYHNLPILCSLHCSRTNVGLYAEIIQLAQKHEAETAGILAVSVLAGFPLQDIPAPTVSVVVVSQSASNEDPGKAVADQIAQMLWHRREELVFPNEQLETSVARAKRAADETTDENEIDQRPVLLLDHGDNVMAGGTADNMSVVHEALKQDLRDIVVGPIADAEAVRAMVEAGVGAVVRIEIGDKIPLIKRGQTETSPVAMEGTVEAISDGTYVVSGPTYTGLKINMGTTVLFSNANIKILVNAGRPQEHFDIAMFTHIGIDPQKHTFLVLKSRMYCRPVFEPFSKASIDCDSGGVSTSDLSLFPFSKLQRPVFPLDSETVWSCS